jgi:hypothetical protein
VVHFLTSNKEKVLRQKGVDPVKESLCTAFVSVWEQEKWGGGVGPATKKKYEPGKKKRSTGGLLIERRAARVKRTRERHMREDAQKTHSWNTRLRKSLFSNWCEKETLKNEFTDL